jgi:hypothetical protein
MISLLPCNGPIKYYIFSETGLAVHKNSDEQGFREDGAGCTLNEQEEVTPGERTTCFALSCLLHPSDNSPENIRSSL